MFKNKRILITGGTGSFGHRILDKLVNMDTKEIIVFSRDEEKQWHLAQKYPNVNFFLGDIRNKESLLKALKDVDIVYQAAALKQVPKCEFFPMEAIKTNILGVNNLIESAIERNVEKVIAISTDKAVKPVNVMGMTKALQEKLMSVANMNSKGTVFACVRYGNVLGSRGSVVPLFKKQIEEGKDLTVTDKRMTRFIITLNEAIDLVFKATKDAKGGEIFVRKAPACKIIDLAEVMAQGTKSKIKITGVRPGEKIHEILISEEEMRRSREEKDYFIVEPALKDYYSGKSDVEFSSDKTKMLNKDEIKKLLIQEKWLP